MVSFLEQSSCSIFFSILEQSQEFRVYFILMSNRQKNEYEGSLFSSISSYLSAFYSPKLLLPIIRSLVFHGDWGPSSQVKRGKALSNSMINSGKANALVESSLSTLVAPLHLFKDSQIERQNKVINQLQKLRHIINNSANINTNTNKKTNRNRQTQIKQKRKQRTENNEENVQCNYVDKINLTDTNRGINKQQISENLTCQPIRIPLCLRLNINQNTKDGLGLKRGLQRNHNLREVRLQFLNLLHMVFSIYEQRFNEYARVMQALTQICQEGMNKNKDLLQRLSMYMIFTMENIKNQINQTTFLWFPEQPPQQEYNENGIRIIADSSNWRNDNKQNVKQRKKNLFKLKERKIKDLANIKQINHKYTQISNQIAKSLKRENTRKENDGEVCKNKSQQYKNLFNTEPNKIGTNTAKTTDNKKQLSKGVLSIKSSMTNQTCRSIIRNNNQCQKSIKRPSIELITSAIEDERVRKLKQMGKRGQNYSRFRHRQALNIEIESSNTVKRQKQIKTNSKKVKKQVMISESNKNSRASEFTSNGNREASKYIKKDSKVLRKSKIGVFQQNCSKLERDCMGSPEAIEHNSMNYFSLDLINISGTTSVHSIKSNLNKVTSKQGRKPRKYTFCYRKSGRKYTNLTNMKLKGKSAKSIQQNMLIIQSAIKEKLTELNKRCKKFNQRFGQILHKNSKQSSIINQVGKASDLVNQNEAPYIMKKSKIMKDRFNVGRSKYRKLNTSGSSVSRQRMNSSVNANLSQSFTKNEMNRRVGITYRLSQKWGNEMKVSMKQKDMKVQIVQNQKSGEGKQKQSVVQSVRNWSRKKVSQKKIDMKRKNLKQQKEVHQKDLKIDHQFVVKLEEQSSLIKDYISFYPNIECTLERISRQYQKYNFRSNLQAEQSKLIELVPLSTFNFQVKKQIQRDLEIQQRERNMEKRVFNEHNEAIKLTKRLISTANKLHQRELSENI